MTDPAATLSDPPPSRDRALHLIVLLALTVRAYHFAYPYWDYFASRQDFDLMVVRSFVRDGFHLFRPQVDWLVANSPAKPSYFLGEFPLIHSLAAALLRVSSFGDWAARLVVLAFSLAGLFWMYALARRLHGRTTGLFAALAWAVLPFSVFFGRAFMSDLPALVLALGSLNYFSSWVEGRQGRDLAFCVAMGALALLAKPTVIGFGLPIAYLAVLQFRWRVLKEWRLHVLAVTLLLPPLFWMRHIAGLAAEGGPPVIGPGIVGRSLSMWLQASAWREQLDRLLYVAVGPFGVGLAAVAFCWPGLKGRQYVFHVWVLGSAFVLFLIPEALVGWNDYYLLHLMPPIAGLIGLTLGNLHGARSGRSLSYVLSGLLVFSCFFVAKPLYESDGLHYRMGKLLNRITRPQDLLMTASGNAADLLYFADRKGWEARAFEAPRVEQLAAAGARVLALGDPAAVEANRGLIDYLDHRYSRLTWRDDSPWGIWALQEPPALLTEVPTGEIQNPIPVNFAERIECLGTTQRQLLAWPTTLEVTYYWQSLNKIDRDLVVFVHVTTPDGRIVHQQDHQLLSGHLDVRRLNTGDVVRERYILTLPGELPAGSYDLRVGWYDPVKGDRLPIVSPGASDGENRARVSEIEVRRPPRFGWFSVEE